MRKIYQVTGYPRTCPEERFDIGFYYTREAAETVVGVSHEVYSKCEFEIEEKVVQTQKVYLVCESVDLGYHVVAAFTSEERATEEMKRLTEKAVAEKIQDLRNIGYTHDGAVEWASMHTFYEIDTVEVQE